MGQSSKAKRVKGERSEKPLFKTSLIQKPNETKHLADLAALQKRENQRMKQQKKLAAKKAAAAKKNLVLSPSPFTPEEEKLRSVVEEGKRVCAVYAREESIPRVRVSWQGCMTWVNYAESPLIENPASAVVGSDKVPRFAQSGMNYQEYLVSGLNLGGTRDLTGATPRRLFHPVPSALSSIAGLLFSTACGATKKRLVHDKAMTKPLPINDQERMYGVGTVQEACEKDRMSYIKSLGYSDSTLRDAAFSRRLCTSSVTRACTGDITYGGNPQEVFLNAIRMAASQWVLFYSLFSYTINFMSRHTKYLYTIETGFVRNIGEDNDLILWKVTCEKPTRLHVAVADILDSIATFVRVVIENTPCPLRPWLTVNIYTEEVERVGTALQVLVIAIQQSQVIALLGRRVSTNPTRVAWEKLFAQFLDLHLFYKAAREATRISRSILKENNRKAVDVLSHSHPALKSVGGYAMCALAYHALVDDGTLPPALAFCPINMELFVAYLAHKTGNEESACYFLHPYTCAMNYVAQQNMLVREGFKVRVASEASYMSFFFNALGPDHRLTMEFMFVQGEQDTRMLRQDITWYSAHNIENEKLWDCDTLSVQPSLYAVNTMTFVRTQKNSVFVVADFTAVFVRKLMDGCIAKHVLYCKTINKKEWFPRVGFMSPVNDPPNHIKRTFMANRISGLWRAHSARRKMMKSVKMWQALRVLDRFHRMKVLLPMLITRRVRRTAKMVIGRFVSSARLRILIGQRVVLRAERHAESRLRAESLLLAKRLGENRVIVSKLARVFVMMRIVARVAKEHVLCLAATRIQARLRGVEVRERKKKAMVVARRKAERNCGAFIRFQEICKVYVKKSLLLRQQESAPVLVEQESQEPQEPEEPQESQEPQESPREEPEAVPFPVPGTVAIIQQRPRKTKPTPAQIRYAQTVHKVANILAHLFSVGNLDKDSYLVSRCAPDGTVLFATLLSFPSISMFACVVGNQEQLLVDAASCLKGLVCCSEWGIANRMWRDDYRRKCADYCMEQHYLAQNYGFATSI